MGGPHRYLRRCRCKKVSQVGNQVGGWERVSGLILRDKCALVSCTYRAQQSASVATHSPPHIQAQPVCYLEQVGRMVFVAIGVHFRKFGWKLECT